MLLLPRGAVALVAGEENDLPVLRDLPEERHGAPGARIVEIHERVIEHERARIVRRARQLAQRQTHGQVQQIRRPGREIGRVARRRVVGAARLGRQVAREHELVVAAAGEVVHVVGRLLRKLRGKAALQLGIGAIPDATGMALKAKHDLGIHTEMFTDSMVELIECGAVNNSKKQIHRGKTVTTFAFGSQRIYDFVDDNPSVEILPVDYVNDPNVICQNDNMISINAAVEVDLFGQVCAESVGTKHMSGSGGQIDYVRGACQSRGGKSFIAFTSTAKGGTISKIKSILTPGAVVTTSKNDVDYIVTEYGVAHLRGRSLGERARQLIAIAHPDFRDELTFEAKKRGIMI